MLDIQLIKSRVAARAEEFLRELFGERLRRERTDSWRVGRHGSLHVEIKGGELIFCDHEAGGGGDCIHLCARERNTDNAAALKFCAAWAGVADDGTHTAPPLREPQPQKPPPQPYRMTDKELKRAARAAHTLGTAPQFCASIAERRQWRPETIQQLARECSLGVEDGKLAFLYDTGIKLRWQDAAGQRQFKFACGKPHSLWRGHMRERHTKRVIISEGETDAIRLIDLGHDDGVTRVFSVPSASTWPLDWQRSLEGLEVVIFALDADEAGQRHVAEWAEIIRPHVGAVRAVDWKEVAK